MHHPSPKNHFCLSAALALFFAFGISGKCFAQFRDAQPSIPAHKISINEFTFFQGDTHSSIEIPGLQGEKANVPGHKSGLLAAGLSFILPGLGEYYVGDQIWRGMIFTALDALFWFEQFRFNARGDDSLIIYQVYANEHFSPLAYADSLNSMLAKSERSAFRIDTNKVKNHDFSDIHKAEDSLEIFGFPDMSHRLPEFGEQDYYEVISKWQQFVFGWSDYVTGGQTPSPEFEEHKNKRGNMNYQYEVARYFVFGLVANRVLSAIDAALLARDHNSAIRLEGELQQTRYPDGTLGFIPTAKIRYTF